MNSVGLVGHYLARDLARDHEVVMYGSASVPANRGDWRETIDDGIEYRVMPAQRTDELVARAWPHVSRALGALRHGLRPPVSTAALAGRGYARAVADDIAGQRFDVLHVLHATQYLPGLRAAAPEAVIVLNAQAEWFPQTSSAVLRRRLAHADGVVGCSHYVTSRLLEHVPSLADRCFTVYDGASMDEFRSEGRTGTTPVSTPFILYVGGVSPHKGLHDLVAAFVQVARLVPAVELRIVGSEGNYPIEEIIDLTDRKALNRLLPYYKGRYLDRLRALVPNDIAGRVHFTGRLSPEDLIASYLSASVFAFPSIWPEGFGLPPVEAMAAGVPVVATRAGAISETVVDGSTGYLVDQGDVKALADRLVELLGDDDRRRSFGAAGRARALETFEWSVVGADLRRVYAALAMRRAGAPV